jgi:hypothetical protein
MVWLIHLLQPRICEWRLHGIHVLFLYVLVFIMLSAHTYEIWEKCLLYWVYYNHLSILCKKVKVICLTFVSTFNVNHSVHRSLYIIITWPTHYNPHLIFLWITMDFNSRHLRTVKGRNVILRLFLQMVQLTGIWGKTLNWGPPNGCFILCMRQSVNS